MTPPGSEHLIEERDLDELPYWRGPHRIAGKDVYTFRTQSSAQRFIDNNAHKDLRVEISAHDENTNYYIKFLSNPGEYHMRGASISFVQDDMHAYGSLSDMLRDNVPISGLEDASFDYFQIRVHKPEREGHEWGKNRQG